MIVYLAVFLNFSFKTSTFRHLLTKKASASGDFVPRPHTGALPLDPTGGLPSRLPDPLGPFFSHILNTPLVGRSRWCRLQFHFTWFLSQLYCVCHMTAVKLFVYTAVFYLVTFMTTTFIWTTSESLHSRLITDCVDPATPPVLCIFTTFKSDPQKLAVIVDL